ncbi:MAG: glutamate racemase [Candidatus Kapaibacteriota bacterium]
MSEFTHTSQIQPIGVFDSGVGGLTVLRHLMHTMSKEEFVYLGDTARVPYGNKSPETIRHYTRQCVNFLLGFDVKAIVIACNTASALALDLARELSPVPVIGMIHPAAATAVNDSQNGKIGIIGTRATIGSHAYEIAIGEYAASMKKDVEVFSKACPLFVPLAEEDFGEHPASELIAQEYLQEFLDKKIDTLVLGCTHYPLLKDLILRTLPGISLVDCGESATNELSTILNIKRQSIMDEIPSVRLFTTDTAQSFSSIAKRCIGLNLPEPIRISQETLDEQGLSGL